MASLVQRPGSCLYYIQFYLSGKLKRRSTGTDSLQIAKEKLRQFESAQAKGDALPLPTRTPIADVLTAYVLPMIESRSYHGHQHFLSSE